MKATYYSITQLSNGQMVDEGIIRNSEDTIYPGQETGIEELPSECEAHHFKAIGYSLYMEDFDISWEDIKKATYS